MSYFESWKELKLCNMVDSTSHHMLYLVAVRLLERSKAANIKWLEEVRGLWRHAEGDDIVLLAIELELERIMAFMAI